MFRTRRWPLALIAVVAEVILFVLWQSHRHGRGQVRPGPVPPAA